MHVVITERHVCSSVSNIFQSLMSDDLHSVTLYELSSP